MAPVTSEKIRAELAKWEQTAKETYAAAVKGQAELEAEGLDFTIKANLERLSAAFKPYDEARERVTELQGMLSDALRLDGYTAPGAGARPYAGEDPSEAWERQARGIAEKAAARFLASPQYAALRASGALQSPDAAIPAVGAVAVLNRDELRAMLRGGPAATTITGGSATSAGPMIQNDLQAQIVDYLRKQRRLAQMVFVGETDSDTVEYIEQSTVTNAAVETAEDAAAPEATYAYATKTTAVKEITVYVPITKRAMSDAGQLRTIVEGQLGEDVEDRLDTQIATGDAAGENLRGIYQTSGILTQDLDVYSRPDALHLAITQVRLSRLEPDYIGIHPTDADKLIRERDDFGRYYFGGPNGDVSLSPWGVPAVISEAFTVGSPLVGAFRRSATLWLREGLNLSAGLNADDFVKRRMSLLAALRAAFAATRPTGFCKLTSF